MTPRRTALLALLAYLGTAAAPPVAGPVRLKQERPAGQRYPLSLGTLFIPAGLQREKTVPLFLHFHGPGWIAEVAAARSGPLAVLSAQLGTGSAVYGKPLADPARLRELLREARRQSGLRLELVGLSGWSAGYGAVRAILRDPQHFAQLRWVILLDGMHAGYEPGTKVPVAEHTDAFVRFARAAVEGKKRFLITHTRIVPGSYASTTETADVVLNAVRLSRRAKPGRGPSGLPLESDTSKGGLRVLGCAGATAAEHVDHLHALPALLPLVASR